MLVEEAFAGVGDAGGQFHLMHLHEGARAELAGLVFRKKTADAAQDQVRTGGQRSEAGAIVLPGEFAGLQIPEQGLRLFGRDGVGLGAAGAGDVDADRLAFEIDERTAAIVTACPSMLTTRPITAGSL